MTTLKIGSPIWVFDENRRLYAKNWSGPIWREHWQKRVIVGETRVSWIYGVEGGGYTEKIPKRLFIREKPTEREIIVRRQFALSENELDARTQAHALAPKVFSALQHAHWEDDAPELLFRLAEALGVK